MNKQLIENILDALVNDGYIIVENALDLEMCKSLKTYAKNQDNFKKAGISSSTNLHLDENRRRDKILWLNEDNDVQSKFLNFTQHLKNTINKELYMGLSYYESHFAIYEKGDFYEKHLDAFKGSKNRVVTTVLYLNEEWDESSGGELIIYNQEDEKIAKVIPNAGTLVVFLSDKFPHEVLPTKVKRHSIAGWFRIDK